jgi:mRNA interferase RelE/StbE
LSEDQPYDVEIVRKAAKVVASIEPRSARQRIARRIRELGSNPRPPGALKLTARNDYRLRVGGWRIIYEVDDTTRRVVVTVVALRGQNPY